jgi:hypothetical protein
LSNEEPSAIEQILALDVRPIIRKRAREKDSWVTQMIGDYTGGKLHSLDRDSRNILSKLAMLNTRRAPAPVYATDISRFTDVPVDKVNKLLKALATDSYVSVSDDGEITFADDILAYGLEFGGVFPPNWERIAAIGAVSDETNSEYN